jgi:hypothetical protein
MEKEKLKISDVLENTTNKRTVGSFEELINGEICYCAMGLIYKKAAQIRNKMIDGIFSATKEVFFSLSSLFLSSSKEGFTESSFSSFPSLV